MKNEEDLFIFHPAGPWFDHFVWRVREVYCSCSCWLHAEQTLSWLINISIQRPWMFTCCWSRWKESVGETELPPVFNEQQIMRFWLCQMKVISQAGGSQVLWLHPAWWLLTARWRNEPVGRCLVHSGWCREKETLPTNLWSNLRASPTAGYSFVALEVIDFTRLRSCLSQWIWKLWAQFRNRPLTV